MPTFSFQEKELNPWTSCCDGPILKSDLFSKTNLGVCPKCDRHHIINSKQKLDICFKGENNYRILDIPIDESLDDPLQFSSMGIKYIDKLKATRTGYLLSIITTLFFLPLIMILVILSWRLSNKMLKTGGLKGYL